MSLFSLQSPLVFTLGVLGNIVSFMVFLAPMPMFYRVFKRRSTEGFHAFPYLASLFSAMLWAYYATVRSNIFLITINSFGCFFEGLYIAAFIAFAPKKAKILTLKVLLLNFAGFGVIILTTSQLVKGSKRTQVLGFLCASFSTIVYIAPLSIVRQVIRTKSVEFMPFWLSFSLLLNALTWFLYGLLLKDLYVAGPNIAGFIFGTIQIILYFIYKKSEDVKEQNLPTMNKINAKDQIHPVCTLSIPEDTEVKDENLQEHDESAYEKTDDSCVQV